MLTKIERYICGKNCYKIAVVLICLNFFFEFLFQYYFVTQIEGFYFFIAVIICADMIKNITGKNNVNYLSIFYCFWPAILLFISYWSVYRISLLPFIISSFTILFLGNFKKKHIKIVVAIINSIVLLVYLLMGWLLFYFSNNKRDCRNGLFL